MKNAAFRALLLARIISFSGDTLSLFALMVHVADSTGQAIATAMVLVAGDFAPSMLAPLTGAISDRFDLKRIMITCELVQAGLITVIALTLPPLPVLLVLVAARALTGQVFQPASRAAVPTLVDDRELESANAAIGFGTNGGDAIGPLAAAALFLWMGVTGVLLVDAATFLVSAALLARLPRLPRPAPARWQRGHLLSDAARGLGYIWSTPVLRIIGLGFFSVVAFNAVDDVALILFAKTTLDAGDSVAGLIVAAVGIGLILGFLILARYGRRLSMPMLLLAGFAASSAGNLLTGFAWAVAVAFALQAVRGLGLAAIDVASNTLLQRWVPADMLGRVFGNLYGAIGIAAGISYIGGGVLLDSTSPPVTLVIVGTGGLLATLAVAITLPRRLS